MITNDVPDLSTGLPARPRVRSALAVLAELNHRSRTHTEQAARPTGFVPLDEVLTGGVRPGELLLLGGKPGAGKTTASLQWARSMAQLGIVSVYVCYEHDDATLLSRLLSYELGELVNAAPSGVADSGELQSRLRDAAAGAITLREAISSAPLLGEAQLRLAAYTDRLILVTGSGAHTDVPVISEITRRFDGEAIALFVDYVQKVPLYPAVSREEDRVGLVVESLKDLALDQKLAVVAIAAGDRDGLHARRMHLHHLRGSSALAYEADAAVMLNEKLAVVSRAHVAHSPLRTEEFHGQVVFSVEKNRNGNSDVDMEFDKDFTHARFHPHGRWVAERLWTEGSIER